MDCYEIWVDLAPEVKDLEFIEAVQNWLDHLKPHGIASYRIKRRKLGFGPAEFHISIEFQNLADLDRAFLQAAARTPEEEKLHAAVYSRVVNFKSALYRDFPDSVRQSGPSV